jgi:alanyl-tRNA synthetase
LRQQVALSGFDMNAIKVEMVADVPVFAKQMNGADIDTLRLMGDQFVQKYTGGTAVFANDEGKVIAVAGKDLVKRGFKAGDLITGIGGKGGGRPNMAQGSLPDAAIEEAMEKVAKVVEEKLK